MSNVGSIMNQKFRDGERKKKISGRFPEVVLSKKEELRRGGECREKNRRSTAV